MSLWQPRVCVLMRVVCAAERLAPLQGSLIPRLLAAGYKGNGFVFMLATSRIFGACPRGYGQDPPEVMSSAMEVRAHDCKMSA